MCPRVFELFIYVCVCEEGKVFYRYMHFLFGIILRFFIAFNVITYLITRFIHICTLERVNQSPVIHLFSGDEIREGYL